MNEEIKNNKSEIKIPTVSDEKEVELKEKFDLNKLNLDLYKKEVGENIEETILKEKEEFESQLKKIKEEYEIKSGNFDEKEFADYLLNCAAVKRLIDKFDNEIETTREKFKNFLNKTRIKGEITFNSLIDK